MENETKIKNKGIKTYAGDMAKTIDGNEGRYIRKIIEEQEEHKSEREELSPESKKNKYFMYIGISLLACALGTLIFFAFFRERILTVPVAPQFIPMIYLDSTDFKEVGGLNKDQISQSIVNQASALDVKSGGVLGIYFTIDNEVIGFRKFLTLIFAKVDPKSIAFIGDDFLAGVVNKESKNFFMLFKIRSPVDVFTGLHSWEDKMFNDLYGFFGATLNSETEYLLTKSFEDGIIQNKNARILRDNSGNIVMMYVFVNDTSFAITNSELAVRELILRLSSSTIKK